MQVGRWGNSLAVRLPSSVVELLRLEEGDEIEIEIAGPREFHLRRSTRKQKALERLKALKWKLPADFSFRRDEAHDR